MNFIRSVQDEMKQVTWPSGKQLRKDVIAVIETTLIFAALFYLMDSGIQALLRLILN